ncbi:MAG TPA: molybdate ABC transporter substrate-binding protein [Acidimicrobiales bacterium]
MAHLDPHRAHRAHRARRAVATVVTLAAVATAGPGCSGPEGAVDGRDPSRRTIRVLAAASLTEVFGDIERRFEAASGVGVTFEFAGSSTLVRHLADGAHGDVLVTADEQEMARAADAGLVWPRTVVARNRLALVVERGNPLRITSLEGAAREPVKLVLCAPEVPCGRLAAEALGRAALDARPASLEQDVKAVLAKVVLGEADAGLVYATDATAAAGEVEEVAIAERLYDGGALHTNYAAAVTKGARDGRAARAFVDFLVDEGVTVFAAFGFMAP